MAQAKQKNTTGSADAELLKLHDRFCAAHQKMKECEIGAVENGNKEQRARFQKWERAVDQATCKGRDVIGAPASTLEGMLMKLHVMGFVIDDAKPGTFHTPYRSGMRPWEIGNLGENSDELALIVSLRDDLHRIVGRQA